MEPVLAAEAKWADLVNETVAESVNWDLIWSIKKASDYLVEGGYL